MKRNQQTFRKFVSAARDALTLAKFVQLIVGVLGFIGAVAVARAAWLQRNATAIWLIVLTLVLAYLVWHWWQFSRRFTVQFHDNFAKDLSRNWDLDKDAKASWAIVEDNTLKVTGSDAGGITKVGANWENYTFTFQAKILNSCLGVVIRAQDLDNYYMLQLGCDWVKPHRRMSIPVVPNPDGDSTTGNQDERTTLNLITHYIIAWDRDYGRVPIKHNLSDWFDCRIEVRGESIELYIDDELCHHGEQFLKNPTGKIGFRNYTNETALVRNVKVTVEP